MNQVQLIGRLTRDVDLRYTQSGKAVATFTLAIDRPFRRDGDERVADFIPVVMWGKAAENITALTLKGHRIAIIGSLQSRSYMDKNDTKHYVIEVNGNAFELLENKKGSTQNEADLGLTEDDLPY
ncbi:MULTISPECIES: single-stranded DNA-binding protein [unclassified Leuconostoc]|uniref:single-stranded DNA-binding protein n=1 Tax=unclassified Leuconostoc TaxID=2685106 RepID=UPI001907E212|nr:MULTISPECIES: single-stranded DNA-binding protein [unclassified Leuconostoc]MBK0040785.1 single-stranded DNA-binding protein [Leuconostoc sp. S51]MBK0051793.1 single-stranded DNA-binding protein [Leuconostoc sp. S50]